MLKPTSATAYGICNILERPSFQDDMAAMPRGLGDNIGQAVNNALVANQEQMSKASCEGCELHSLFWRVEALYTDIDTHKVDYEKLAKAARLR